MPNWFGVIVIGFGALGLVGLGREFSLLARIRSSGVSATGTVVGHAGRRKGVDRPVIRFADHRGQHVEFTPQRALMTEFVPEGEQFPVLYLADEPQKARLANEEARPRSLLVLTLLCLGLVVAGLLLMTGALPSGKHGVKTHSGPQARNVILTVMSAAGLCFLGYGSYRISSTLRMRRSGITTTGKVIRVWRTNVSGGRGQRKAAVEFVDANQRRIQFVTGNPPRSVDRPVHVVYWPDRPDQARLASVSRFAFSMAVPTLFCALMVGLLLFL